MAKSGGSYRFFSITSEVRRAHLRKAFFACKQRSEYIDPADGTALLLELVERQEDAMEAVHGGELVKAASANGHSTLLHEPGTGAAAPQEFVEMWENLISQIGGPVGVGVEPAKRYLNYCALHGLDIWNPDSWPSPIPPPIVPTPPPASDLQIFEFVMHNLVPITEVGSDYFWLRIKAGLQLV